MKKIKFSVVGYGHIGKRHVEIINQINNCVVEAIADIKDKELLQPPNNIPFYNSLEDLLKIDVDVVCIATPNGLHTSQAIAVLESGKHVVIEKPLALTKNDADKIITASQNFSKKVFAVMQNRYSPPAKWIKNIVTSGTLGRIFSVTVNCYWNRDERYYLKNHWHGTKNMDGGILFTQFSHFIDMIYWLFGDIKNIQSRFHNFNHAHLTQIEDSGNIQFEFINGGYGALNYSTSVWDKNFESSMTIIAENGSVKIGGQYMNKVEYCEIKNYIMPALETTNAGNDYGTYKGSAQNHHFVFQNVVDVLLKNEPIATTAQQGMKVVEIIEQIYYSKN